MKNEWIMLWSWKWNPVNTLDLVEKDHYHPDDMITPCPCLTSYGYTYTVQSFQFQTVCHIIIQSIVPNVSVSYIMGCFDHSLYGLWLCLNVFIWYCNYKIRETIPGINISASKWSICYIRVDKIFPLLMYGFDR